MQQAKYCSNLQILRIPVLLALSLSAIATSCNQNSKQTPFTEIKNLPKQATTIYILPLGRADNDFIASVYPVIKKTVPQVVLLPAEKMPAHALYKPRNRYRADSLIRWLSARAKKGELYAGITMQDISTTKNEHTDFGVMGLGYMPGNACVASSFRLRQKKNFLKVLLHELGHTAGLPHCPCKTCYMRDAEGGDFTGSETGFCKDCTPLLKSRGWHL